MEEKKGPSLSTGEEEKIYDWGVGGGRSRRKHLNSQVRNDAGMTFHQTPLKGMKFG